MKLKRVRHQQIMRMIAAVLQFCTRLGSVQHL